jgi:hypothetical protein
VSCLLILCGANDAHAQPLLTGYLQTVPLWSSTTPLSDSTASNFNRFRLTTQPTFGPFSFEAAYEHAATFRQRTTMLGPGIGTVPSGGEYLELQWTVTDEEHVLWRHRFDRLQVGWSPTRAFELSAGRQTVSWGTTLFLTPADPFIPFNPADPFRQFRAGVDGARARIYPSPLSELDIVVRPTKTDVGEELTALARGLTVWRNWELSGWAGSLYGDVAGAFGTAGALGVWAVRGEAVVRSIEDEVAVRGTVGVDRAFQVGGRDVFFLFEYQRDGFGATSPDAYLEVVVSDSFRRGEFQVIGRDETVVQVSYQLHPLWSLAGLWLWNLNDRSALLAPSFAYSASNEASISGGVFFGFGNDEISLARPLPSEYGVAGTTAYVSLSWFF